MRRGVLRSLSVALASLLGACDTPGSRDGVAPAPPPDEIAPPEYGPPPGPGPDDLPPVAPTPAAVTLRGKVVQAGTEQAIEGIQVTFGAVKTTTDAEGLFTITLNAPLAPGERHALIAADMDGQEHGGDYHSGSVRVVADDEGQIPLVPDGLWRIKLRRR